MNSIVVQICARVCGVPITSNGPPTAQIIPLLETECLGANAKVFSSNGPWMSIRGIDTMKFLNPVLHGYIDYLYVLSFALAPTLLTFYGPERTLCYVLGAAVLALSLFTRYPLGLVRKIRFNLHGMIELGAAVFTIAAPWLFRFNQIDAQRDFFITAGMLLVVVFICTNYHATEPTEERVAAKEKEKEKEKSASR